MTEFSQETIRGVARHTRSMLKSMKRGRKDTRELAYALAAAKIVVATLEKACEAANVPQNIFDAGEEMSRDMGRVVDLLGPDWRKR